MKILISEILNSKSSIFHDEGLKVYNVLEKPFKEGQQVELSFYGIKNCSTQFLNACIGKLMLVYGIERALNSVHIAYDANELPRLQYKLKEVEDHVRQHYTFDETRSEAYGMA